MTRSALAALAAATVDELGDPQKAVDEYLARLRSKGYERYSDPLYPNVVLFQAGNTVKGYVIKKRRSSDEADREVATLENWADINELELKLPYYLPLVPFGNIVLSPFVGPEIYMVEQLISDKINRTVRERDTATKEDMISLRRALVLRQLDLLARAVVSPYIPRDEKKFEIIDNKDVVAYYKKNMKEALRSIEPFSDSRELDPLDLCLDFLFSHFIRDTPENRVRYLDTYSRNLCLRVTTGVPTQMLHVTLDDILAARRRTHQEYSDDDIFQRDMRFLRYRLVQVDGHRNEKIALVGEMEANIIQAPRLLDCTNSASFDLAEQTNALCHFLLQREFETARVNGRTGDHLSDILKEIKKTERGDYRITDLKRVISIDDGCREHYEAMSLYKAIRWLGYVCDQYIPKYKSASPTSVSRERLALYEKDKLIYRSLALRAIHTLMDTFYNQLEGAPNRKMITLNHGAQPRTYSVDRTEDGAFTCYSGKRGGVGKPIVTTSGFNYHIRQLDVRAQTDTEKAYAGLLKLGCIEAIICRAT